MKWQPVTVYELVREPSAETTIADVLVGVVFVVMGLIAVALAFGLAFAGVLIVSRRFRDTKNGGQDDFTAIRLNLDKPSPRSTQEEP